MNKTLQHQHDDTDDGNTNVVPMFGKDAEIVREYGSILAGKVSPTSYQLPEDLTYGEWEQIGDRLRQILNAAMWWLGEWWRYGEHRYGERAHQAAPLGYKADTLRRAARVCERVPPEERDERLTFGHYVALARLEVRPRGRIRDQAIAEDWTVRDIEHAVSRLNAGEEVNAEAATPRQLNLGETSANGVAHWVAQLNGIAAEVAEVQLDDAEMADFVDAIYDLQAAVKKAGKDTIAGNNRRRRSAAAKKAHKARRAKAPEVA
jgi:hypothetical protein